MDQQISELLGMTLTSVTVSEDKSEIRFATDDGKSYRMWHSQDCCESVYVESITGDLADLIGSPILKAEEATSDTRPTDLPPPQYQDESQTWAFYKLATAKGYVDIRWYGSSNGYYSERVDFGLECA